MNHKKNPSDSNKNFFCRFFFDSESLICFGTNLLFSISRKRHISLEKVCKKGYDIQQFTKKGIKIDYF